MKPLILQNTPTGQWYIVTKYTRHETHITAHTEYDVTDQMQTIFGEKQQVIDALVTAAGGAMLRLINTNNVYDEANDVVLNNMEYIERLEKALSLAKQTISTDQQKGDEKR